MIRLLILLLIWPSLSLAGQGMYPVPMVYHGGGPAEFCDGTDTFCTSWETGTDALNTGATGNEDVFDASTGNFARVSTTPIEGDYYIYGQDSDYVAATNGGSGFGSTITVTGFFRLDTENANVSYITTIGDNEEYYAFFYLQRLADGDTANNVIPVGVFGKFTSGTVVQLGSSVTLNKAAIYTYTLTYNMTTDTASCIIKDSSDTTIFDQSTSVTLNFIIDYTRFNSQGYGYISHDGVKINP